MTQRNRLLLILGAVLAVLLVLGSLISAYFNSHRKLIVSSDKTPITLQLNDTTYTIKKNKQKLTLPPDTYNYRVKTQVDGETITLQGTVDLAESRSKELNLRFDLFSTSAVSDALCATQEGDSDCPYQSEYLTVQYFESYKWAVVSVNHPSLGRAYAVLQVDNGTWNVEDGPGTDIKLGGYYPEAVEEAVKNAQQ